MKATSLNRSASGPPPPLGGVTGGIVAPAAILTTLGLEVLEREGPAREIAVMWWLHAHVPPLVASVRQTLNTIGGPFVTFPLMVLLPLVLWWRGGRRLAAFAFAALWSATALQWALKALVGRPRPELWPPDLPVSGLSFPSGHATTAAALAMVVTLLAWRTRWRWPALILGGVYAVVMALSRVVLGVHYPTDVVAGICTAILGVTAVSFLTRHPWSPS